MLIRTILVLLFAMFGTVAAFAAPEDWVRVSFSVKTQEFCALPVKQTNTARAPPTTSANVTTTGDALSGALRNVALNNALATTQFGIGNLGLGEGSVEHALLHGLAGCAFAEVSGGDCAAGLAAGVAQSVYAGYVDRNGLDKGQAVETAALIGAGVGFLFSSGEGQNVSIGNTTAQSGFTNNYLSHTNIANLEKDLSECEAKETGCR